MSYKTENIKFVQHLYSLFSKQDIDSILNLLSPEVEWGEPANPYNPAGGICYGQGFYNH